MKNITIRQLQIFTAAATHLSFARAAEELHLTHAAISLQIKQLEEVSNSILFDRIGKRVYLTDAGEVLLDHARRDGFEGRRLTFAARPGLEHLEEREPRFFIGERVPCVRSRGIQRPRPADPPSTQGSR